MKIAGLDISINSTGVWMSELDDKHNIISESYNGFTSVAKISDLDKNITFHHKEEFKHCYDKYKAMHDKIIELISPCSYVAIEGYAYSGNGLSFNIAEFTGMIKTSIYFKNIPMQIYDITHIKQFATDSGKADKIRIEDETKNNNPKIYEMLSHLPEYKSPKSDILDAHYICRMLRLELVAKTGIGELLQQDKIDVFLKKNKKTGLNLLNKEFIIRGNHE